MFGRSYGRFSDAELVEFQKWIDDYIEVSMANPHSAKYLPRTLLKENVPRLCEEFFRCKFLKRLSPDLLEEFMTAEWKERTDWTYPFLEFARRVRYGRSGRLDPQQWFERRRVERIPEIALEKLIREHSRRK